jgi:hypothetical protein
MPKIADSIAVFHQDIIDYAVEVLRKAARQLYLQQVPFPPVLGALAEELSDATHRVPERRSADRWEELQNDLYEFATGNLNVAAAQLLGLGVPLGDILGNLEADVTHSGYVSIAGSTAASAAPSP